MYSIEYAKNPTYATPDGVQINLIVKFVELPMELPFTATLDDIQEYGIELYVRATSGEFGPVGEYVEISKQPATLPQATVEGAQTL